MKFLSDTALVFLVRILSGVISITTNLYLAKTLGPAGKGILSLLIMVLGLIVLIASLGYQISGTYYAAKKEFPRADILTTTIIFTFLVSVVTLILSVLFFQPLQTYIFHGVPVAFIIIILSAMPFYLFVFYMGDIFWAMSYPWHFVAVSLATVITYLILSIALVGILKLGVAGAVWAFVFSFYFSGSLALILAFKMNSWQFHFNRNYLNHAIKYGMKAHIGRLSQQVTYRVDIPLVSYFSGFGATGYYSIAVSLAELLWYIPRTVSFVLFPRVARIGAKDTGTMTAMLIRSSLWISIVFAIFLYLGSTVLITFWLPAYHSSLSILLLLIPGIVVSNIFQLLTSDLLGRGEPALVSSIAVASSIVAIVLYFLLIPKFGPWGAAAGSSIAYILQAIVAAWVWVRRSNIDILYLVTPQKTDFLYFFKTGNQLLLSIKKIL